MVADIPKCSSEQGGRQGQETDTLSLDEEQKPDTVALKGCTFTPDVSAAPLTTHRLIIPLPFPSRTPCFLRAERLFCISWETCMKTKQNCARISSWLYTRRVDIVRVYHRKLLAQRPLGRRQNQRSSENSTHYLVHGLIGDAIHRPICRECA